MRSIAKLFLTSVACIVAFWAAAAPLRAVEVLPRPQGEVILTVTGHLQAANDGSVARFDRAMLDGLPQTKLISFTDWTIGQQTFEGVLLKDLLQRLGANGDRIAAVALNDYAAVIPWEDLEHHDVLLALTRNGADMPVRDKGPIWIIYPNDRPQGAAPFEYNDRMVWQLKRLDVQ